MFTRRAKPIRITSVRINEVLLYYLLLHCNSGCTNAPHCYVNVQCLYCYCVSCISVLVLFCFRNLSTVDEFARAKPEWMECGVARDVSPSVTSSCCICGVFCSFIFCALFLFVCLCTCADSVFIGGLCAVRPPLK
jgi:hypothetical protein